MAISRTKPARGEPEEHRAGAVRARAARLNAAAQLSLLLIGMDATGSHGLIRQRIHDMVEAGRQGDPRVTRAAAMELSRAAAAFAVHIDLALPLNGNGQRPDLQRDYLVEALANIPEKE